MAGKHYRTHLVSDLGEAEIGSQVRLAGWLSFKRVHKRVAFAGLRDGSWTVQVVCAPDQVVDVPRESCISVAGIVQQREPANEGHAELVEVLASGIDVVNPAAPLPVPPDGDPDAAGRRRWRYLDMRRPDFGRALLLRARVAFVLSQWAAEAGFVSLDTPYLAQRS